MKLTYQPCQIGNLIPVTYETAERILLEPFKQLSTLFSWKKCTVSLDLRLSQLVTIFNCVEAQLYKALNGHVALDRSGWSLKSVLITLLHEAYTMQSRPAEHWNCPVSFDSTQHQNDFFRSENNFACFFLILYTSFPIPTHSIRDTYTLEVQRSSKGHVF